MANEVVKKDAAKKPAKERKFKLGTYLKEMWGEVKKLSWMSRKDLVKNTAMVLVFVLVMSAVIWVLDLAFSAGIKGLSNLTAPAAETETVTETVAEDAEAVATEAETVAETAAETAAEGEPAATTEG